MRFGPRSDAIVALDRINKSELHSWECYLLLFAYLLCLSLLKRWIENSVAWMIRVNFVECDGCFYLTIGNAKPDCQNQRDQPTSTHCSWNANSS